LANPLNKASDFSPPVIAVVSGASVTTPSLPFSWVAASGGRRQRPWRWRRCSNGKSIGSSLIWSARAATCGPCQFPAGSKAAVDDWLNAAEVDAGPVFRAINKAQQVGKSAFSPKVIWGVVKAGSSKCSLENVAPQDLRRTCARLCHEAGGELEQIQFLLGHVSVQTTERYLGCKQRLRNAVNDRNWPGTGEFVKAVGPSTSAIVIGEIAACFLRPRFAIFAGIATVQPDRHPGNRLKMRQFRFPRTRKRRAGKDDKKLSNAEGSMYNRWQPGSRNGNTG
jgi:hypothetical protein